MTEIDRAAELFLLATGHHASEKEAAWLACKLVAAGLVLLPREPDEATIERVARAMYVTDAAVRGANTVSWADGAYEHFSEDAVNRWDHPELFPDSGNGLINRPHWRMIARAAYRAATEGHG